MPIADKGSDSDVQAAMRATQEFLKCHINAEEFVNRLALAAAASVPRQKIWKLIRVTEKRIGKKRN